MARSLPQLSRFELQVLRLLWTRSEASVADLHGDIEDAPSYSTVRKIVERLESKGAIERWAESLAGEVAAFGLGVTILVTGTFKTDILVQTSDFRNYEGPYAQHYVGIDKTGEIVVRAANPPERFARVLKKALDDRAPLVRRTAGIDATMLVLLNRFLPGWLLYQVIRLAMRLPRAGALRALPSAAATNVERRTA